MLNVQYLRGVEVFEKYPGLRGLKTKSDKVFESNFLLGNVSRAFGDVPLCFFQMAEMHRAVSYLMRVNIWRSLAVQAGARSVSQPPAPSAEPQPVMW